MVKRRPCVYYVSLWEAPVSVGWKSSIFHSCNTKLQMRWNQRIIHEFHGWKLKSSIYPIHYTQRATAFVGNPFAECELQFINMIIWHIVRRLITRVSSNLTYRVWYRYNPVNFLVNHHDDPHPVDHPSRYGVTTCMSKALIYVMTRHCNPKWKNRSYWTAF